MKMMEAMFKGWDLKEKLLEAFKIFDSTDSGSIAVSELKHVMTSLDIKMAEADAESMANDCRSVA
jgi:Ca2+-binding EF-hand superfamily protein